jgi:hypothetical protein
MTLSNSLVGNLFHLNLSDVHKEGDTHYSEEKGASGDMNSGLFQ